MHMQKSHGLFIPDRQRLAVDLETFIEYLHLIIFGYHECIQCGTSKATVQAIQQHMTGKGHCKFDISEQNSEFAEFYLSDLEYETDVDVGGSCDATSIEETPASSGRESLMVNNDSLHLLSGRIISKKSTQAERSLLSRLNRHNRTTASRIEYSAPEPSDKDEPSQEEFNVNPHDIAILSRKDKREMALIKHQLTSMSATDRRSLMHLSSPEQRSILAMQHRQAKKAQKEEQRRQSHVDRKGNKNLYAYWATETPVYLCG